MHNVNSDLHKKVVMDPAIIIQVVETGIPHPKISTVTRTRENEIETVAPVASITNLQRKDVRKEHYCFYSKSQFM